MKKILIYFVILMLFASCGKMIERWMSGSHACQWHVRNDTDQTLKLKFPSYSASESDDYRIYEIEPGTRIQIDGYTVSKSGTNDEFDNYFKQCAKVYGEGVSWQILSEDDIVLKVWNYSDFDQSGQRFFEDSSWFNGSEANGDSYHIFEIQPEDIVH